MVKKMGVANSVAITMCNAIVDAIDAGAGTAQLQIYDGTRPAFVDGAVTNLIVAIPLPAPAFGAAVDDSPGAKALGLSLPVNANATIPTSATATWFRIVDRDLNGVIDGNVSTSNADLILDNVLISNGQNVQIDTSEVLVAEVSP